jgi:hypothetical protein
MMHKLTYEVHLLEVYLSCCRNSVAYVCCLSIHVRELVGHDSPACT